MFFFAELVLVALVIIAFKLIIKILLNIEKSIRRDIRDNKLKYGYISRKDLAVLEPETKIRNGFLYRLVSGNSALLGILPYNLVFKDSIEEEFGNFTKWCDRYMETMGYINRKFVSNIALIGEGDISDLSKTGGIREVLYSYSQRSEGYLTYVLCVLIKQSVSEVLNNDDLWPELGEGAVQVFAGKMASDGIRHGILITTGNFTVAARRFAQSIKMPNVIELLDGIEITKRHRAVVGMELRKLLTGNT